MAELGTIVKLTQRKGYFKVLEAIPGGYRVMKCLKNGTQISGVEAVREERIKLPPKKGW